MDRLLAPQLSVDRRVLRLGSPTGESGDLTDPFEVSVLRDTKLPPTAFMSPTVAVIDLNGQLFSPASLRELIIPLGQRIKGGLYGDLRLVLVSADPATREFLDLLASRYAIPLYFSRSAELDEVSAAEPLGQLTASEVDTLDRMVDAGWQVTVSGLANMIGIEATAANNRLVNLERDGYVYRVRRHRRHGDLFIDPRAPRSVNYRVEAEAPPKRAALSRAGVDSDPYDTGPIRLEGEAAARAAEILQRRRNVD